MAQQIANGLFQGSIYALFALGYSLIFGVLDILNLAHYAVFTCAAFICLTLIVQLHMPIAAALPATMLAAGAIGLLVERIAFRPLRARPGTQLSGLLSSIGLGLVLESVILLTYGPQTYRFPPDVFPDASVELPGVRLGVLQLATLASALLLMLGLVTLLRRTRLGLAIRAVSQDARAARLLGVDVDRAIALTFFIASALGGAAGVFTALQFKVLTADIGRSIELKGLAVIIVGGMSSVPGAVAGGLLLGLTESLSVALTHQSALRDAIAFTLLFLVLLIRPSGLFGARRLRDA